MKELLIDSAIDEDETNSPTKMTHQKSNEEMLYLSRTKKGSMPSKIVIDKINKMKMNLDSKKTFRKTGKAKVDSVSPTKSTSSAKQKRVDNAVDMGQGDDRMPDTSRLMTDAAMAPPILKAGLRSASYQTKRSDCTLEM